MSGDARQSERRPDVLAIHPGALGDVIIFGHLLKAVGGQATLLSGGEKGKLLMGLGVVARTLDFDSLPMHELFIDPPPAASRLGGMLGRREWIISCFGGDSPLARQRLEESTGASRLDFLPVRPGVDCDSHLIDLWAGQLALPPIPKRPPPWPVPADWRDAAARQLQAAERARGLPVGPRGYIVIHPGAGSAAKCWPLKHFAELAQCCRDELDLSPVFVLGPVECEQWTAEDLAILCDSKALRITCPSLQILAGLLAGATGFVGNDSGPAHLASAIGVASVVLFGPTSPVHFAPLGQAVQVLAAPALADIPLARVVSRFSGDAHR
ncbi:MAG: glycosyltransferase family 9 protein [Phycisphaerae bacterium]